MSLKRKVAKYNGYIADMAALTARCIVYSYGFQMQELKPENRCCLLFALCAWVKAMRVYAIV